MSPPVETWRPEAVTKPDRAPDFVAPVGHAFWWAEMIFMHVMGGLFSIKVNQEDASLYWEDLTQTRHELPPSAHEQYAKWWYEVFESKVLGNE